ncbi:uncharacterized protein LOC110028395 [Phalaenopsis equestris]|uniref:uncharacterized protein LOC110028395 n=1 Tax=Phalaenopsis equestris TaxID=78828 RepID=UPI0009E40161|nr:uncharacterized protein LOC110028395 [Phalaenopsis equestris]
MATRFHSHLHRYLLQPPKDKKGEAEEALPGLTDLMNDWLFGHQPYNMKGGEAAIKIQPKKEIGRGERPPPLSTSRLTQDWLEEAKRMVAAGTASRHTSPVRSAGSRRFVAASQAKELSPPLDKRDALSRSARRTRATEGLSEEILQRSSARHNRNRSDYNFAADYSSPPASQQASHRYDQLDVAPFPIGSLPPKLPPVSRSRFLERTQDATPRRSFRTPSPSSRSLSSLPPDNLSPQTPPPLSPPRNLFKPSLRRTISTSTCSIDMESTPRRSFSSGRRPSVELQREEDIKKINEFLRRQRATIAMASDGEVSVKAKIVLSSYTPDASSMVAAICYSWLLENMRERDKTRIKDEVVVPVINMRRARMWEHKQAAWLFHHIGIDASALIFSDELDLEGLLMGKQLNLLIVGQDVLQTNGEVGSLCTVLTDNYCEDAYDLLRSPNIKKLLLAGILLDTKNLSFAAKSSTNRDAEAVQLLLVGSSPDYKDFLFEQVTKERGEESFLEALRQNYGKLIVLIYNGGFKSLSAKYSTSNAHECCDSNELSKKMLVESTKSSNVIKNADFREGMNFWTRNSDRCQAEVVSSGDDNYAIVSGGGECWPSIEQNITEQVYVGSIFEVSADVSAKGGGGEKFEMYACFKIENLESFSFLRVGRKNDGILRKIVLIYNGGFKSLSAKYSTSNAHECCDSNELSKKMLVESTKSSNVIKNADFREGMNFWTRNSDRCQAEVVSSGDDNYAIVSGGGECWPSIEQNITEQVYVGSIFEVSADVSAKGAGGEKFEMYACFKIENLESFSFLRVGRY